MSLSDLYLCPSKRRKLWHHGHTYFCVDTFDDLVDASVDTFFDFFLVLSSAEIESASSFSCDDLVDASVDTFFDFFLVSLSAELLEPTFFTFFFQTHPPNWIQRRCSLYHPQNQIILRN